MIGYDEFENNFMNWYNDSKCLLYILHGQHGCGKTMLLTTLVNKKNIKNINFDCSTKLSKKILCEKLHVNLGNANILEAFHAKKENTLLIFDELDNSMELDNISISDIEYFACTYKTKTVLCVNEHNISKLVESIDIAKTSYKLGNFSRESVVNYFQHKYSVCKNTIIELHTKLGDDIRQLEICLKHGTNHKKRYIECNLIDKLRRIHEGGINELLYVENDPLNILITVQENYIYLNDKKDYTHVLQHLVNFDIFHTFMYEHQSWNIANYAYCSLIQATKNLALKSDYVYKKGTLWSKQSNTQYKKKLLNNFMFSKKNIIFTNVVFIHTLKEQLLQNLKDGNLTYVCNCLKCLGLTLEDLEQLSRLNYMHNEKRTIKTSVKTKMKKLLNTT